MLYICKYLSSLCCNKLIKRQKIIENKIQKLLTDILQRITIVLQNISFYYKRRINDENHKIYSISYYYLGSLFFP